MTTSGRVVGPRMLDVASSCGVSRATVSLVMRGSDLVAERTRRLVLDEADRLGYVYDRRAADLRTSTSTTVAAVMPDIVNPFVAEVVLGLQAECAAHGYLAVLANTTDDLVVQTSTVREMIERRVAGLVWIPALGTDAAQVDAVRRSGIPAVTLMRETGGPALPRVQTPDTAIGRLGAQHLLERHRCRRVAYFGGDPVAAPRGRRCRAFERVLGVRRVDHRWHVGFPATAAEAYCVATALLAAGAPPDGVLCHSDAVAFGLLRALRDADVALGACRVVGIDDVASGAMSVPSLTSVAVHPERLGRRCASVLLRSLGRARDLVRVPAPTVTVRESCGCG